MKKCEQAGKIYNIDRLEGINELVKDCERETAKDLKAKLLKALENISNADEIYSESQKKFIDPWTIEGCAVMNIVEKDFNKIFEAIEK